LIFRLNDFGRWLLGIFNTSIDMKGFDSRINILLISESAIYIEILSDFLIQAGGVVEVSSTFDNAYLILRQGKKFDVILIDFVCRPFIDVEWIRCISAFDGGSILIFSTSTSLTSSQAAMEAGAAGCFHFSEGVSKIVPAINAVVSSGFYISRAIALKKEVTYSGYSLSERDISILRLLGDGCCNKDIAKRLRTTEGCIKAAMNVVFKKLGAKNRTDAFIISIRERIL
jgi:DNA-binding NarL/FixJ family response regulator